MSAQSNHKNLTELDLFLKNLSETERAEFYQRSKEMIRCEEENELFYEPSAAYRLMFIWNHRTAVGKIKI